jgi:hypothetical protein
VEMFLWLSPWPLSISVGKLTFSLTSIFSETVKTIH